MAEKQEGNFLTDFVQRISARWSTDSSAQDDGGAADWPEEEEEPAPAPEIGRAHV